MEKPFERVRLTQMKVPVFFTFIVACTVILFVIPFQLILTLPPGKGNGVPSTPAPCRVCPVEQPKKGKYSDCKFVYLDVGTNIGVQIRKLFEPSRYPMAPVAPIFDDFFGADRKSLALSQSLCAIGIEMNPSHSARLSELQRHYTQDCGYMVDIMTETAASTFNGKIDFWTDGDMQHEEWGASVIFPTRPELQKPPQTVSALDLAAFIITELAPYSKKIVMKLDVEGAERDLVPRLIMSGALCHLDIVFMEEHMGHFTESQKNIFLQGKALFPDFARVAGCKVQLSMLDDESFLHDADPTMNTC